LVEVADSILKASDSTANRKIESKKWPF
jgi:hypothetical protein